MGKRELVLNSPTWNNTGMPVGETIRVESAGGLVVNVETTGEPPLRFRPCCHNAGAAAEGNVPPRDDPDYGNNDPNRGYGQTVAGVFGFSPPPVPDRGERSNADTYPEQDTEEMERRRRKFRNELLGLREPTLPPVPGFPSQSRLAEAQG